MAATVYRSGTNCGYHGGSHWTCYGCHNQSEVPSWQNKFLGVARECYQLTTLSRHTVNDSLGLVMPCIWFYPGEQISRCKGHELLQKHLY